MPEAARLTRGEAANPLLGLFNPEALADFRKLAQLRPSDYRAIGLAAASQIVTAMLREPSLLPGSGGVLEKLPEDLRRTIAADVGRLEELAQNPDRVVSAGSSETLGVVYLLLGEDARSAEHFRRAVTLDPSRQKAWDMLQGLLFRADKYEDALAVSLERLKQRESVWSHFLVAQAYEYLNRFHEAEEQLRAALRLDEKDLLATLGLAALLLRRADNERVLAEADEFLGKGRHLMLEQATDGQRQDYQVTRGIYQALTGDTAAARVAFEAVLLDAPDHAMAKKALQALKE
jgi:tetratricopeptide (TPR) repeat protein